MFWKQARERYGGVTADDEDVRKYLRIAPQLQQDGYTGVVGYIQDLGHRWVAERTPPGPVLEIGFGTGRHRLFFSGRPEEYFVSDSSEWHVTTEAWRSLRGRAVRCDARQLPYRTVAFETVISIYNLEHISDLDSVLREAHRVLRSKGRFLVALPCEGGLLWNLGRELTTRPRFQHRYGINYDKIIAYEHVRDFRAVLAEIRQSRLFRIDEWQMLPFHVRTHHLNLIACLRCAPVK